jgi:hypothetical protein
MAMNQEDFKYKLLETARTCRFITIEQGEGGEEVRCILQHECIDECSEYEAWVILTILEVYRSTALVRQSL